jgi:hypothetical protein
VQETFAFAGAIEHLVYRGRERGDDANVIVRHAPKKLVCNATTSNSVPASIGPPTLEACWKTSEIICHNKTLKNNHMQCSVRRKRQR